MSGPFSIQRVARSLGDVLSLVGGEGPKELSESVYPTLELLQFYGLQQRQVMFGNAAGQVQGGSVTLTPSADRWSLLFGIDAAADCNAGLTGMALQILIRRQGVAGPSWPVASRELNPVIAANFTFHVDWQPGYPLLLPPGTAIFTVLSLLTGLANTTISCTAEIGLFG